MKRWKRNLLVYAVLVLWTSWPILSILLSQALAWIGGSTVDEGNSHPCIILGFDFGELAYTLFVLGWLMFLTFPTGALGLAGYTIFAIVEWRLAKRKNGPPPLS